MIQFLIALCFLAATSGQLQGRSVTDVYFVFRFSEWPPVKDAEILDQLRMEQLLAFRGSKQAADIAGGDIVRYVWPGSGFDPPSSLALDLPFAFRFSEWPPRKEMEVLDLKRMQVLLDLPGSRVKPAWDRDEHGEFVWRIWLDTSPFLPRKRSSDVPFEFRFSEWPPQREAEVIDAKRMQLLLELPGAKVRPAWDRDEHGDFVWRIWLDSAATREVARFKIVVEPDSERMRRMTSQFPGLAFRVTKEWVYVHGKPQDIERFRQATITELIESLEGVPSETDLKPEKEAATGESRSPAILGEAETRPTEKKSP